ncbi:MAG: hypothetical protein OXC63_15185 [Aestuariivita sp.]|nr:hypothetical protein [Aestuariivita sp.]MCY4346751.1 hypothetical protein [Aestuariivita sp.]
MEERTETKQAEYHTDIARLAEQSAHREVRLIFAMIAIVGVGGLTIFGFLTT